MSGLTLGIFRNLLVKREFLIPFGRNERRITPWIGFHCVIESPESVRPRGAAHKHKGKQRHEHDQEPDPQRLAVPVDGFDLL